MSSCSSSTVFDILLHDHRPVSRQLRYISPEEGGCTTLVVILRILDKGLWNPICLARAIGTRGLFLLCDRTFILLPLDIIWTPPTQVIAPQVRWHEIQAITRLWQQSHSSHIEISTYFNISLSSKHRILKLFTCTTISCHLKQISRVASNPLKWSNCQDPVLSTADSHGMELVQDFLYEDSVRMLPNWQWMEVQVHTRVCSPCHSENYLSA